MKILLLRLATFAGRHWLRLGLIACALFLLSQKQINFNLSLGHPAVLPVERPPDDRPPSYLSDAGTIAKASAGGFLSRFNIFGGGGEPGHYERLVQLSEAEVTGFLDRFSHVAESEQVKYGIPPSVMLGLGLLYSKAGTGTEAKEHNNYFGLACVDGWQGDTGRVAGECRRRYETAWLSFRDFSQYVTTGKFSRMRQFGPRDHRMWAAGLQELGFNDNEELAAELAKVIERYGLTRFD